MTTSQQAIIRQPAHQLAAHIANGELSSKEVVEAFIRQIERHHHIVNAMACPCFDHARREAEQADSARVNGASLGPLHGVPVTIKECFHLIDTPSTMGLTARRNHRAEQSAELVKRLQSAGAIILGKTNVPQLMMWHECDNPLYGCTTNPWDSERTCGGSTGGEAAIIASLGSPLGLGNDLGGSIRIPAHFCGICGIKPSNGRLPRGGTVANFRGMESMKSQPGPMARHVIDLALGLESLNTAVQSRGVPQNSIGDFRMIDVSELSVGVWSDDDYFAPSPAIRRAVDESAEILAACGANVERWSPPHIDEAVAIYFGLMSADGGADLKRRARGSERDWRVKRLLRLASLPQSLRKTISALLGVQGQRRFQQLLSYGGPINADRYWQLTYRMIQHNQEFAKACDRFDVLLCPPHALPAMQHRKAIDLLAAGSYAYLANLLGWPAGVLTMTTVGKGEESDRPRSRDMVDRKAKRVEEQSLGLPVAVQVIAKPWREDHALAIMHALESVRGPLPEPQLVAGD